MRTMILRLVFSHLPKPEEESGAKWTTKQRGQGEGPARGRGQSEGRAKLGTGSIRERSQSGARVYWGRTCEVRGHRAVCDCEQTVQRLLSFIITEAKHHADTGQGQRSLQDNGGPHPGLCKSFKPSLEIFCSPLRSLFSRLTRVFPRISLCCQGWTFRSCN